MRTYHKGIRYSTSFLRAPGKQILQGLKTLQIIIRHFPNRNVLSTNPPRPLSHPVIRYSMNFFLFNGRKKVKYGSAIGNGGHKPIEHSFEALFLGYVSGLMIWF